MDVSASGESCLVLNYAPWRQWEIPMDPGDSMDPGNSHGPGGKEASIVEASTEPHVSHRIGGCSTRAVSDEFDPW